MTPRPWHRSRLFWTGLVGLMALLWMWLVMAWEVHRVSVSKGGCSLALEKYPGYIEIFASIEPSPSLSSRSFEVRTFKWLPTLEDEQVPFGPPLVIHHMSRSCGVFIERWFTVTLYTLLWLGLLIWWQRRKHRLTIHHPSFSISCPSSSRTRASAPPPRSGPPSSVPPAPPR